MGFLVVPRYSFRVFSDISPYFLKKLGIKFLMLDVDNTIAKYSEHYPSDSAFKWVADMNMSGIMLFFISNSRQKSRVETFAEELGIDFIKNARKPSPDSLLRAMAAKGFDARESALIGDQIFTDTLAANRAGVVSIIVRPLSLKNPFHALRFAIEVPFRVACANKAFEERL